MLYNFLYPLSEYYHFLNLLRYLSFRSAAAIITSLIISFVVGPYFIKWLKSKQKKGQPFRLDGPDHIIKKAGTPTMGGGLILISLFFSTILWADLTNAYVWILLYVTFSYGLIGFCDDYMKLIHHNHKGLSSKIRFFSGIIISITTLYFIYIFYPDNNLFYLSIPFLKFFTVNLGLLFIPFSICVIVGTANAVNLTDGLDGLAIVPVMICAACFGLIAYLVGNSVFSDYLRIEYVAGTGELSVFCGALVGASLGFLWFNAPPAMVFMGDTGSLAIGGALGTISIMTHHEIVLFIIGGLFVVETISVILQVGSFKLIKKRIFKMAPLHHHFEKKGWQEATIVIRFWILSIILAIIGLSTLKLR